MDEYRSRLALVAASVRIRRPSPERLPEMLTRSGPAAPELKVYLAETSMG